MFAYAKTNKFFYKKKLEKINVPGLQEHIFPAYRKHLMFMIMKVYKNFPKKIAQDNNAWAKIFRGELPILLHKSKKDRIIK